MFLRWLLAALHLLALVIGTGAICTRASALHGTLTNDRLRTVFRADAAWGMAALLWIATGVWRAFGGIEKGTEYYLSSTAFWIKMALLAGILILEIRPAMTITRWRLASRRDEPFGVDDARLLGRISVIQSILVGFMVIAATAMARGLLR